MTLILDDKVAATAAATHALVIGVGAYPFAKAGCGGPPLLEGVEDIQSAANGAMLMVDWLLANAGLFSPPLATLDVLIGSPGDAPVFPWAAAPGAVGEPTTKNVRDAGDAWLARASAQPGNVALLYITGHGAVRGNDPVVFLADLNQDPKSRWAFLNVRETAIALKKIENLAGAFLLSDACQEFIPTFELSNPGIGARFTDEPDPMAPPGVEKVALLTASAQKTVTYEGEIPSHPGVNAGRFTQTVLHAFEGAAARDVDGSGTWVGYPGAIYEDLKQLYLLRPDWRDRPLSPSFPDPPNTVLPMIRYPNPPEVPLRFVTEPEEAMKNLGLSILGQTKAPPILRSCLPNGQIEWMTSLPASFDKHWLLAHAAGQAPIEKPFFPARSIFGQVLKVPA
ncbi:caspase family protein [Phenylobacterium sp. LH3H17]|uniref:caspase family protein n=1 Tax=Phenylobacterium sp. LH3H17 TaxID=2903901 RepID=UPI0020C95616|nr:caspase family protein [Phenylobacterium sp. LH3H17]UTP40551.1 caspase family protein [Phenylobacterium sp. LH3H17]